MNDSLDQLSDSQLSELVAVEVCGMKADRWTHEYDGSTEECVLFIDKSGGCHPPNKINFATSANDVLPLLEKSGAYPEIMRPWTDNLSVRMWEVRLDTVYGLAPSFARAACIALLRAHRAARPAHNATEE